VPSELSAREKGRAWSRGGVNASMVSADSTGFPEAAVESAGMSAVPQCEQTRLSARFSVAQLGQGRGSASASAAPQFLQNLLFGLFAVPHWGQ
jgi:hypothetical protein